MGGEVCGVHHGRLNEVLNHFYRHHFKRTAKDSVFEEALACFHADCPKLFMTHDKLVKHLQYHDAGRDSLYYIKYIMDQMEEAKTDAVTDVKRELEQKREQDEEEKTKLKEDLDRFKKDFEESKGDTRHYRKKVDTLKQEVAKAEAELAKVEAKTAAELKETKASLEQHIAGRDNLVEAKVKLECKLDIQKRDNEELKKFKRAHEGCGA